MERETLNKLSTKLVSDDEDFMTNLRHNIDMYLAEPDMTVKKLSELSDIPYETLKGMIYGKAKDCKLSTAIHLAKALNISIDELAGANTLNPITKGNVANCRNLPEHQLYLVRWFINRQVKIFKENRNKGNKVISVIKPHFSNGYLEMTNVFDTLCIDSMPADVKAKVFVGLKISCEYYMPHYSPFDTLLLASDRSPLSGEKCVIIYYGRIFIVKRDGDNYVGIINQHFKVPIDSVEDVVGYIVGTISDEK